MRLNKQIHLLFDVCFYFFKTGVPSPKIILDDAASDTIFNFNLSVERKSSDVSYMKNVPVTELLQNEDIFQREFTNENDDEEDDDFSFKDTQVFSELVLNVKTVTSR